MALERRVLPPEEWGRLVGTESEPFAQCRAGQDVHPVVVEEHGRIVGTWTQTSYLVAEGLWAVPDHRQRIAVFRSLIEGMRELVVGRGAQSIITASMSDQVTRMLTHYGAVESPGTFFVIPLHKERPCPQQR